MQHALGHLVWLLDMVLCRTRRWTPWSLWAPSNSTYSVILWFCLIINTFFYMARIGCGASQPMRLHQRIWNIYISARAGKKRSLLIARGKPRKRQKEIEPHTCILDSVRKAHAVQNWLKAGLHKKVLPSLSNPASAEVSGVTWERPVLVYGRGQLPRFPGISFFPGSSVWHSHFWNNTVAVLQ